MTVDPPRGEDDVRHGCRTSVTAIAFMVPSISWPSFPASAAATKEAGRLGGANNMARPLRQASRSKFLCASKSAFSIKPRTQTRPHSVCVDHCSPAPPAPAGSGEHFVGHTCTSISRTAKNTYGRATSLASGRCIGTSESELRAFQFGLKSDK